ncbi:MAG TPA: glycosyltransferase [Polyangia bacterium]|nr:glycosyltransferase [Polyangia bacterium]
MATSASDRPTILYFGNDWAAENRTSSHHVARWLAKRYNVIYIDSPGLRAPKGTGRDLKKLVSKVALALRGPRPMPEGLSVQTLLQIPFHGSGLVRAANRRLILATLKLLMRLQGIKRPLTWFVVPHLASVAGALDERLSVYYCIDDYAALPDVDVEAVKAMDDELTRKANVVFVASGRLLEPKRALNPDTHVSPHGVDYDHFVKAQDPSLPLPDDVAGFRRPIIGFFGLIERWIDLPLVAYLAEARPDWTFLMIGRVAVPDSEVPRLPNLHFLGRRPYESLPAYGKAFTAAIIPYHLTQQVMNSNPLKLREYLAMGKPIVSVSAPEIDKFADWVAIARTREEFLAKLDRAVAEGLSPEQARRQTELASTMTWDANLRKVIAIVEERLAARG